MPYSVRDPKPATKVCGEMRRAILAQQLDFENLPGVAPEDNSTLIFEDNDNGSDAKCTTAFEPLGFEDNTPKRVYKCKTGNITITSEDPPPGNQPHQKRAAFRPRGSATTRAV